MINPFWKDLLWRQCGAGIDTLDDMIRLCPDALWRERLWMKPGERPEFSQYWYRAYHALFWLDLLMTGTEDGFMPPAPFELIEMSEDTWPSRVYTQAELRGYLQSLREKCRAMIEALTDETAQRRCTMGWGEASFAELQIYNLRHLQEIAAQLSLFLGQHGIAAPDFEPIARD